MRYVALLCLCLLVVHGDPVSATQGLITRLLGAARLSQFAFQVIPADPNTGNDVFEYETVDGLLWLRGNTGVAMSSALGWYLKYVANASWSWGWNGTGNQLNLPATLPTASLTRMVSPVKFRYYMNVCTVSYSMAWWNWSRWEQEIDWMALNGVNLPLSFTGQEYVWDSFYRGLGLTEAELQDYYAGAAFLAWQRMGNIKGWAGPLDADWMTEQRVLQLQFLNRTREFGMINALPGFSGHVPGAIARIYPDAKLVHSAEWSGFNSTYGEDYLLEPTDKHFMDIATAYYKAVIAEYGTDHVFQMDTYNEMDPSHSDDAFLAASNKVVFDAMRAVDPQAIYLMQGWLFHSSFWGPREVKAYLSAIPNDGMIILDLNSDQDALWQKYDSYYGKPFIWCMLHNYGGRRGLYGNLTLISTHPLLAKGTPGNTMIGTGMTMEAIETNPVMYDMMNEMGWRSQAVDLDAWVQAYARRRYGGSSPSVASAWTQLHHGAYSQNGIDISLVELVPSLPMISTHHCNATAITQAWRMLLQATSDGISPSVGPFLYDVVDVTRQSISNLFADVHTMANLAYQRHTSGGNATASFEAASSALLGLISDMDAILATNINYLLGNWLDDAKSWGVTAAEVANKEFNARNQITLWGPTGQINDYAAKHWAGLVGDYYRGRWSMHVTGVLQAIRAGKRFDQTTFLARLLPYEQAWGFQTSSYNTAAVGDTLQVSQQLLKKYGTVGSNYQVHPNTDSPNGDMFQAWTHDIGQLMFLCDTDPTCLGFNSNGWVKSSLLGFQTFDSTFFVKRNASRSS